MVLRVYSFVCFLQMEGVDSSDSTARSNVNNGDNKNPNPVADLHDFRSRRRSLDIEIVNRTGRVLRFIDEDFRSGTWFFSPDPVNIKPGETCLGYACSRVISFVGVHGGMMYELVGSGLYLYIGFNNQVLGPMKIFIELNNTCKSARWASNQVQTGSVKNISHLGLNATAVIKPPKQSPFRLMQYTLEEDE